MAPDQTALRIIAIAIVLALLWISGRSALSRTSRAAAYATAADLIEGTLWARAAWPKHLSVMVVVVLIHALGVFVFLLLMGYCAYFIWRAV